MFAFDSSFVVPTNQNADVDVLVSCFKRKTVGRVWGYAKRHLARQMLRKLIRTGKTINFSVRRVWGENDGSFLQRAQSRDLAARLQPDVNEVTWIVLFADLQGDVGQRRKICAFARSVRPASDWKKAPFAALGSRLGMSFGFRASKF